jgi:hypothetical protein
MQLAGWVRKRFEREGTGQVPAIPATGAAGSIASPGTHASPGTMAAPSTMASPATSANTPTPMQLTPPVYPPRRVVKLLSDTGEGTEIYSASDLDQEEAQTIKGGRKPPPFGPGAETMLASDEDAIAPARRIFDRSQQAAEEATLRRPQPPDVGDETEIVRSPAPPPDEEDSESGPLDETFMRDRRSPIPSGPTVVPTRIMPPSSGPGHGPEVPPTKTRARSAATFRRRSRAPASIVPARHRRSLGPEPPRARVRASLHPPLTCRHPPPRLHSTLDARHRTHPMPRARNASASSSRSRASAA